jgi:DNA-binding transcriptional ArsR family regulator
MTVSAGEDGRRNPGDRIFRALGHPLRRRILASLARQHGSASTLSKEFGLRFGTVAYHLIDVLDCQCGLVERIEEIPRRGAKEHVYAIKDEALTGALPWAELPQPIRSRLHSLSFEEFCSALMDALSDGSVDALEGSRLEWRLAEVDLHGWQELRDAADQYREGAKAAVENSRRRSRRAQRSNNFITVMLAFAAFGRGDLASSDKARP